MLRQLRLWFPLIFILTAVVFFFRVFELRIGERLFQKTNKYILRHHICFMALLINLSEIGGINKTEISLEKVWIPARSEKNTQYGEILLWGLLLHFLLNFFIWRNLVLEHCLSAAGISQYIPEILCFVHITCRGERTE